MIPGVIAAQRVAPPVAPVLGPVVTAARADGPSGGTASYVFTLPANAAGDMVVMQVTKRGGIAASVTPAGWTLITTYSPSSVTTSFYKKVMSAPEASVTLNTVAADSDRIVVCAITIQAGTYIGDVETAAANIVGSVSADPPSLSPSWGSAYTLWLATMSGANERTITAFPFAANQVSKTVPFLEAGLCTLVEQTATKNPGPFTMSASENGQAYTIAIR